MQWASGIAHSILITNVLAFFCFGQVHILEFANSHKLEAHVMRLHARRGIIATILNSQQLGLIE